VFVYEWCLVFDLKININIELINNTEYLKLDRVKTMGSMEKLTPFDEILR